LHEYDYRKLTDKRDHIEYCFYEGGDFWVGPDFGCVHWSSARGGAHEGRANAANGGARMNAKRELVEHIQDREVKHVHIIVGSEWAESRRVIDGTLDDVLPQLDFEYDSVYGWQEVYGNIWYTDGTWSDRAEYDGSEWWEHKQCPEIPGKQEDARP